jgi:DNA-binding response OmpR family regulator
MQGAIMSDASRILVVDDDPDLTGQLELVLKQAGYAVTVANSQAEAEEVVLGGKPDLAVVDLMMETQDAGFVLCYELKRLFPGLPIIILTSVKAATGLGFAPQSADEQSWVKADSILDKPVRPERLKAEIQRLLARPAAKASA